MWCQAAHAISGRGGTRGGEGPIAPERILVQERAEPVELIACDVYSEFQTQNDTRRCLIAVDTMQSSPLGERHAAKPPPTAAIIHVSRILKQGSCSLATICRIDFFSSTMYFTRNVVEHVVCLPRGRTRSRSPGKGAAETFNQAAFSRTLTITESITALHSFGTQGDITLNQLRHSTTRTQVYIPPSHHPNSSNLSHHHPPPHSHSKDPKQPSKQQQSHYNHQEPSPP